MLYAVRIQYLLISYLSIPGIVAHDRCNVSHIFTFSFQFQCRAVALSFVLRWSA